MTKRPASKSIGQKCEAISESVTRRAGSTGAFATALSIIVVWALLGPIFHFSDTWQLVINTGTTIVTFLMVFLIQRAQNKHALAIQLKLNELVAALDGASNRLIDIESLSEKELTALHHHYGELATLAGKDRDVSESHSIDEARLRHSVKRGGRRASTSRSQ